MAVLPPAECSDGMSDRSFGIAIDLFLTQARPAASFRLLLCLARPDALGLVRKNPDSSILQKTLRANRCRGFGTPLYTAGTTTGRQICRLIHGGDAELEGSLPEHRLK